MIAAPVMQGRPVNETATGMTLLRDIGVHIVPGVAVIAQPHILLEDQGSKPHLAIHRLLDGIHDFIDEAEAPGHDDAPHGMPAEVGERRCGFPAERMMASSTTAHDQKFSSSQDGRPAD